MAFPAVAATNGTDAQNLFISKYTAAGFAEPTGGLSPLDAMAHALGNLMTDVPAGVNITNYASPATMGGAAAGANTASTLIKRVTAIADNTATNVLTITVPNAAHAACVQVTLVGIAGASGAIGTCEDVTSVTYNISIARTPGVAMGATASTAFGSAAAVVVGAGTMTCVGALTLVGEGVTVANTAQFKATIDQSSTSTLHICLVYATVINYLGTGVTIA